jgi:dihydropteroate synthase
MDEATLVMGIVNRTPDSFYDRGATFAEDAAFDRVGQLVDDGVDVVDIGGVPAGHGPEVDVTEEAARVVGFVGRVREAFPDLVISVDTWRSQVADQVCAAGADLVNDAWGGYDAGLVDVVARHDAAIVCTHRGAAAPRTDPVRVEYANVMADVIAGTTAYAERALAAGVSRESILVDPAHDFGKSTFHSLEVTRRLGELTATGWPVLVSLSNKDFVGEALDLPLEQRLSGTLAATAVCALAGARVFRVHQVAETRQVVDMVSAIAGHRPPTRAVRGLA